MGCFILQSLSVLLPLWAFVISYWALWMTFDDKNSVHFMKSCKFISRIIVTYSLSWNLPKLLATNKYLIACHNIYKSMTTRRILWHSLLVRPWQQQVESCSSLKLKTRTNQRSGKEEHVWLFIHFISVVCECGSWMAQYFYSVWVE